MSTKRFLLQKILQLFLTLFLVTAIAFILMKLSPIDAAEAYARRVFTVDNSRIDPGRNGLKPPACRAVFGLAGRSASLRFGNFPCGQQGCVPHCWNGRKGNRLHRSAGDRPSGRWGLDFRHSALPGPQKFCWKSAGLRIHRGNFHTGLLSGNIVY